MNGTQNRKKNNKGGYQDFSNMGGVPNVGFMPGQYGTPAPYAPVYVPGQPWTPNMQVIPGGQGGAGGGGVNAPPFIPAGMGVNPYMQMMGGFNPYGAPMMPGPPVQLMPRGPPHHKNGRNSNSNSNNANGSSGSGSGSNNNRSGNGGNGNFRGRSGSGSSGNGSGGTTGREQSAGTGGNTTTDSGSIALPLTNTGTSAKNSAPTVKRVR